jgi:hypothetical protein
LLRTFSKQILIKKNNIMIKLKKLVILFLFLGTAVNSFSQATLEYQCSGDYLQICLSCGHSPVTWTFDDPSQVNEISNPPLCITVEVLGFTGFQVDYDAWGCDSYGPGNPMTASGSVSPSDLSPSINASSNSPICIGSNLNLTESGGEAVSWDWTGPNSFTSSSQNPTISSVSSSEAGLYTVTITDPNLCTNTEDVTVTVNSESSAPTGASASSNPVCPGDNTTLSVQGGSLGAGASWHWYSGSCGGTYVGSGSPTVSPVSTTTYSVRAEGTCNTTSCANVTVTVNTESTAPTGITGTTTICPGDNTTLSVQGGSLGTGASWEWYSGSCGGTSVGSGSSVNVSPASNTTYYVLAEGTCNTTSCANVTVTVNTESNTPTGITGTTSFCTGESTTLSVSGGSLGTGAAWEWYSGSCGGTSEGSGTSINVSPGSNTDYYVRAEGTCNTTLCATATVTVNPPPAAIAGSNSPLCAGEDLSLTETGGDATSWSWSGPGSFSSPSNNPGITGVTTSASGTYTVTVTDATGCTNTDDVSVTVNSLPSTPVTTIDCSGGVGNGIITVTSPTGAEYEYDIGTGYQSSPSFGSLTNGTYVVTVSNTTTGCTAASNSIDLNCGCADPPTLTLSSTSGSICGINPVTVSGNTFGGSATEVNLSHDGSGMLDATNFTTSPFDFTYTPVAADAGTTVIITVTTDNPLGAPCTLSEETYTLTVNPIPSAIAGSNSPVCAGETLNLTESGGDASSWSWSGPDGFTSPEHEPTISPVEFGVHGGTYEVTITDANGCTNTSDTDVIVPKPPTAVTGSNSPLCEGEDLHLTETGTDAVSWTWTGPDGFTSDVNNPTITSVTTAADGLYSVTITDSYGCTVDDDVDVTVNPTPAANAGSNSPVCASEDLNLTENGGDATTW